MATFLSQTGIFPKFFSSNFSKPLSGFNNPAIVLRRVVLPDNVRPKIVYKFPFLKLKETSLRLTDLSESELDDILEPLGMTEPK